MDTNVRRALELVTLRLRAADVPFALGGSGLLSALGLLDDVRDLDLMLPAEAHDALRTAAGDWWLGSTGEGTGLWASAWRARLEVGGVEVDAIGGLALRRGAETVRFPFTVEGTWRVGTAEVPLAPVDQWREIYAAYRPERAALLDVHAGRPYPETR